jgi:hypothetical protein
MATDEPHGGRRSFAPATFGRVAPGRPPGRLGNRTHSAPSHDSLHLGCTACQADRATDGHETINLGGDCVTGDGLETPTCLDVAEETREKQHEAGRPGVAGRDGRGGRQRLLHESFQQTSRRAARTSGSRHPAECPRCGLTGKRSVGSFVVSCFVDTPRDGSLDELSALGITCSRFHAIGKLHETLSRRP